MQEASTLKTYFSIFLPFESLVQLHWCIPLSAEDENDNDDNDDHDDDEDGGAHSFLVFGRGGGSGIEELHGEGGMARFLDRGTCDTH
jgi:hypothetical protein